MSTPNPVLAAAAPSLINILTAVETLVTNIGTDPAQVAVKLPGALAVFLGTVEMQLPGLAASELGTLQSTVNSKIAAWVTSLKAMTP